MLQPIELQIALQRQAELRFEKRKLTLPFRCEVALQPVQQPRLVVGMVDALVHSTVSNWPMYSFSAVRPR